MVFEYELPDVGEGVAEGEIVAWHVDVGDEVKEDQVLAEVETDKAVVDLPSPVDGTILELHAEEGEIVAVDSVVVTIDVDGDAEAVDGESASADEPAATSSESTSESTSDGTTGQTDQSSVPEGRVFAPPNVRRLARELGVDISTVDGTGPSGRITEGDVRAAAEGSEEEAEKTEEAEKAPEQPVAAQSSAAETPTQTAVQTAESADRERTLATPATRRVAKEEGVDLDAVPTDKTRNGEAFVEAADVQTYAEAQQAAQEVDTAATGATDETARVTTEPYRGVRRTIGERMAESVYTAPHATHHDTAEVSGLVEAREELKSRAEANDVSLTYMPFVMKAIVAGLKEYPVLNSELDEENEEILYKHYYDIGVAVATDAGLMVPVVENVDEKGLLELAAEVRDLATRARERKLSPDELRGSTFTITNFGAIGGEYAKPVINYPETAIMGLGAIEERPVAADGEVVARPTLPLSLSIDHRVIDGAEAAQFCNTVIEYLENPMLLLLE